MLGREGRCWDQRSIPNPKIGLHIKYEPSPWHIIQKFAVVVVGGGQKAF